MCSLYIYINLYNQRFPRHVVDAGNEEVRKTGLYPGGACGEGDRHVALSSSWVKVLGCRQDMVLA